MHSLYDLADIKITIRIETMSNGTGSKICAARVAVIRHQVRSMGKLCTHFGQTLKPVELLGFAVSDWKAAM